jgi:(p)ppGpp synthase/HD superfamily hydrolase
MKNFESRISKLEKVVQKILHPEDNKKVTIIVDRFKGETEEEKIAEMEKKLKRKLSKRNIHLIIICPYGYKKYSR